MFRVLLIFSFVFIGCQSRQPSQLFEQLALGMLKGDVLETLGSPVRSTRKNSIDKWYYYMEPENPKSLKVLHFKNSRLAYKGDPIKPLLTAEEMEEIKKQYKRQGQGNKPKPFKRSVSDKQLKEMIKKEMKSENKKSRFEEL